MSHADTTLDLLDRSRESLTSGYAASAASARYLAASLAALRAGAAIVAARSAARPGAGLASGGDGPHDVWALTARVAPELTEWAQRFFAATGQRVGVEAGPGAVTAREADDLLRDAETFVDLAAGRLGRARRRTGRSASCPCARPEGAVRRRSPTSTSPRATRCATAPRHPSDLVERAAEHGQGALALTDRDGLYGAVRFAKACGAAGIAPVLGVDLAVEPIALGAAGAATGRRHPGGVRLGHRPDAARPRSAAAHPGARRRDRRPPAPPGHRARPRPGRRHRPRRRLGGAVPAGLRHPPARRARRPGQPRRDLLAEHARPSRGRRRGGPGRLVVLLGPDSDVGRAVLAGRRDLARDLLAAWRALLPRDGLVVEVVCHGGPEGTPG